VLPPKADESATLAKILRIRVPNGYTISLKRFIIYEKTDWVHGAGDGWDIGSCTADIFFDVADNDFAVFAGTSTSITELLYQNDYTWSEQLSSLSTLNFSLQPGETTLYVLGLGGGGQENISGTINGVDITSIPTLISSDIGPYLTDYENQNQPGGAVETGAFDVSLNDVQIALPSLTWSDASVDINDSDGVIQQSPDGIGYDFPSSTAHLFQIDASSLGVTAVPEPGAFALMGLGLVGLVARGRKK
jgi:hypothetical protein